MSSLDGLELPRLRGLLLLRVAAGGLDAATHLPDGVDALVVCPDDTTRALKLGAPVLTVATDARSAASAIRAGAVGVVVPADVITSFPAGTFAVVSGQDGVRERRRRGAETGASYWTAARRSSASAPPRCATTDRGSRVGAPRPWPTDGARGCRPHRRPRSWLAGMLIGLTMVATGLGGAVISSSDSVLLGYDRAFLGGGTEVLDVGRLLPFVRHDRISFAGVGLSIGILYLALAWWGLRRGARWAVATLGASCAVGMATLLLFLGFGYFDPLHATVTALLLPLFLVAVLRPLPEMRTERTEEPQRRVRERALVGQLLLVVVATGLMGGGVVISAIAVGGVFVPSDLDYLG